MSGDGAVAINSAIGLQEYLDGLTGHDFTWDHLNCCHFSGGWVELVTGSNPMTGLRLTGSPEEAKALIEEMGGLQCATSRQLGSDPIAAGLAQLGDVLLVETGHGNGAIGICCGRDLVLINTKGDMSRLNLNKATCAWRLK